MKLHHVGIVVESLESSAEAFARSLGLARNTEVFHDPIQKVGVQFWGDGPAGLVEFIEPASPDSPAWRELKKGGGLNHICYEVEDLDRQIADSVAGGSIVVSEPVPAVAFSGRRIAFLYCRKLGLVEFVESGAPA